MVLERFQVQWESELVDCFRNSLAYLAVSGELHMTNTLRPWLFIQLWVSVRGGPGTLSVLCQQTCAALRKCHLIFGYDVIRSKMWCSRKSLSRVLFSKFSLGRCEELWGAIPDQAPTPLPNHRTFPFVPYGASRVQRPCGYFSSHFWKWCLLKIGNKVSKVFWPLWFQLDWKHLHNFKAVQGKTLVYCLGNKWWVGEFFISLVCF